MSQLGGNMGAFSEIVDEQVRQWALRNKKSDEQKKYRPIITLSRAYGTEGDKIGEAVAKKLGFSFWNQKLVHTIAENSGLRENLVQSLDEHSRSGVEDILSGLVLGEKGTLKGYVKEIFRVVHTIEAHGGALIIGRGAQFILKEKAFKVRIVAAKDCRINWVAKREKISTSDAEQKIDKVDQERFDFHQQHYGKNHLDPEVYDHCLNVEYLTQDAVVRLIIQTYKDRFPGVV